MRKLAFVIGILLVSPVLMTGAPVGASGSPLVDAGASGKADVDAPVILTGSAEGFAGTPSASWTADADCDIDDPASFVVAVSCATTGAHVFTLTASDGAATATDSVRIWVYDETYPVLASASGVVTVGALGAGQKQPGSTSTNVTTWVPFDVPPGTRHVRATLSWTQNLVESGQASANDFDLGIYWPNKTLYPSEAGFSSGTSPEVVDLTDPVGGRWNGVVRSFMVPFSDTWTLDVRATVRAGDASLPTATFVPASGVVGSPVTLGVNVAGGAAPYSIAWEDDAGSSAFDDGTGATHTLTFAGATPVKVKVTDAAGYETIARTTLRADGAGVRPITVVAVIDSSFSPYHFDFTGAQHPWNRDADASNDIDFTQAPETYIEGHPGAISLPLTVATDPSKLPGHYRTLDASKWSQFRNSQLATNNVKLYWFPGTKVVGAVRFASATDTGSFYGDNNAHGTRSAASAAGNWHGTCRECVFVLIQNANPHEALKWTATQNWIDVVTNSYGQSVVGGSIRDNVYFGAPVRATRAAAEAGQTIVFSAGNGLLNAFDAPMLTYWSSQKGPDWMVTVGATTPRNEQTYSGAGKPVDISSIGLSYPSSGNTVNGTGYHSGTSNAAPTVAGYFASLIQSAREAFDDADGRHVAGVVASGPPVACGAANAACALGDGVLTRKELYEIVYKSALPSTPALDTDTAWPTTPLSYYYQGYGVLSGRIHSDADFEAELGAMLSAMRGESAFPARPAGETNWFVVDSMCRQKLWGAWNGGDYTGVDPTWAPGDSLALAFYAWCVALPDDSTQAIRYLQGNPEESAPKLPGES